MLHIQPVTDWNALYAYQSALPCPYHFPTAFGPWEASMLADVDGAGRRLFRDLTTQIATDGGNITGFIQLGHTAFGFAGSGEISDQIHYPIIRSLYFDAAFPEAGEALLHSALAALGATERIYAFFHYFGLSCFARHGKLFAHYPHIESLLKAAGFTVEHENVYYASQLPAPKDSPVTIVWNAPSAGAQQSCDFFLEGQHLGGCEVHYVQPGIAYLRWIYVGDGLQNRGLGSLCMTALMADLSHRGYARLDTDTALNNLRAQHYYEKNSFTRMGITRSFYLEPRMAEIT